MSSVLLRKIGDASVPVIGFGAMGTSFCYDAVGSEEERFKASSDVILEDAIPFSWRIPMGTSRGDPEYVKGRCYASLKRLGVDHIDLYYQHQVDPDTPIEKTVEAMAELEKSNTLVSQNCTTSGLRRANAIHPIAALQIEYSPFILDVEKLPLELIQTARELGVKIVAYSPRRWPVQGKEFSVVDRIGEVAKRYDATPGQAVLAWILAQGEDFFVILGTKKIKYLEEENLKAASPKLTSEEIEEIRQIAEETEIPGERYDPRALEANMSRAQH
ncbi:Aldo/keto reductase [Guyanagaster necrorhizus]|uniref:Aldo/keto reductase n=1 Tax=Guyanagaster necrorhizus TaxID=856835 RepID=A0A9P7VE44_9AGAR|nr:Aldo/keto reductase [Guyanagaster necrorhizus MCA 3950]KAG7439228.1 Aldo/keto reductase [Guyanagaster necrorhizus MCA 3950]